MKIFEIYNNFNNMVFRLEDLKKKYETSIGVENYLLAGLLPQNPWYKYKDKRWAILICNGEKLEDMHSYICARPYEVIAKAYSEKKHGKQKLRNIFFN